MMRVLGRIVLLLLACGGGVGSAELLLRVPACRGAIAKLFGQGELVAIVNGVGIYESDHRDPLDDDPQARVVAENLMRTTNGESVAEEEIEHELNLLRFQFPDETVFAKVLESSAFSVPSLREELAEHLRARQWLEKQIAPQLNVTEADCRQFYDQNRLRFELPRRFRAAHVLLAAHAETPPETVEAKRRLIQSLSRRVLKEKNLPQLAMEISEDEATKLRGGDLGIFTESRMLPEFFAEVAKLQPGQISPPFQTPLGFHIVQLTGTWPSRQMTFEEAQPEIAAELLSRRRAAAVAALAERLSAAEFIRAAR